MTAAWPDSAKMSEVSPQGAGMRAGKRAQTGRLRGAALTARSGLRLSLCDTARMTPARQPRQLRPLCPRSGRASSPTATHRNRFPTSSGRVSTAIVDTSEADAALSTAREPTKPRAYRPPMLKRANQRTAAAPRANERGFGGAPDALPRRAQRPRSLAVLLNTPWTP